MFERYSESALRAIFYARMEASNFGSSAIETEHLLLGVIGQSGLIGSMLTPTAPEEIRTSIAALSRRRKKIDKSVDLPLSHEVQRVLAFTDEEAERQKQDSIEAEHIGLGLLRVEKSFGAQLLKKHGVALEQLRQKLLKWPDPQSSGRIAMQNLKAAFARQVRQLAPEDEPTTVFFA